MSLSLDLYWLELYQAALPWLTKAVLHMQRPYAWLELFSSLCALLGSLLLALKGRRAGWGWVLFAFSNAGWFVFANGYGHWFFLLQQIGFSITSAIGIWKYLVKRPQDTILMWRFACGHGLWRMTQIARVAEIWREQGRTVQGLTAAGDWV